MENRELTFTSKGNITEEWENCLQRIHGTLAVLQDVREKITSTPTAIVESDFLRSTIEPDDHSHEIKALEQELLECREDLKRDEEIFSEKVNELNRFRLIDIT